MKINIGIALPYIIVSSCSKLLTNVIAETFDGNKDYEHHHFLSMIGHAHLQYHPAFFEDLQDMLNHRAINRNSGKVTYKPLRGRELGKMSKSTKKKTKPTKSKKSKRKKFTKSKKSTKRSPLPTNDDDLDCDPVDVQLLDYPQWQAEKGYWIGEYTFLQGDGNSFVSSSWNYPYDHYKGFITGEVVGNSYRQRNVFLYPPQVPSMCDATNESNVVGGGQCGVNGNTKVFKADQSATTCSSNEELGGDIEGPYVQGPFVLPTKTELVGRDNALLYQVFIPGAMLGKEKDILLQSQLTTITESPSGQVYRTRTAQSFDAFVKVGETTSASYYRERKVDKDEFYATLDDTIVEYNIRNEDLCVWDSNNNAIANVTGSLATCEDHLEQSFALGSEM